MTGLLILPIIGYIILSPIFFKLVFPNYLGSLIYSQYYVLILIFIPKNLIAITLNAHAKKKDLYILSISTSMASFLIQLILLPIYGIKGAIASELILQCIDTVVSIHFFRKLKQ
jgi:O-antigen/teichoic acid export membrane protein